MIDQWRGSWRVETDSLAAFIDSQCELVDIDQGTSARDLWGAFKMWAEDVGQSGAAKMSLTAFTRSVSAQPNVKKTRKRPAGKVTNPIAHFSLKLIQEEKTMNQWNIK